MKIIILIGMLAISSKIPQENVRQPLQPLQSIKELKEDLVCKMKINTKSTTTLNYLHEKVNYSFCSEACKKNFIKQPSKYIKKQK